MDRMPNVADRDEVLAASEGEAWSSPFAGGLQHLNGAAAAEGGASAETGAASWVASPFAEGLLEATGSESESAFKTLLAELHDEEFEEALQGLIDEAAGRYLTAAEGWSGESGAGEVEAWLGGIANQADRLFEHLERQFEARTPESLLEGEFEAAAAEALAALGPADLGGEQLFGSLVGKLFSVVKGAAKFAVGGLLSRALGPVIRIFRRAVQPIIRTALPLVASALPEGLKADAAAIAAKLGITLPGFPAPAAAASEVAASGPGAALAELFDAHLAQAALSDNEVMAEQLLAEWESPGGYGEHEDGGALARLDAARATLAQQLTEAAPGSVLTSELEQFIPAVLAVLPLARTVISLWGRNNLVNAVAGLLAPPIKLLTGAEPSKALTRAIADKGLRLLRLEAEAPADRQTQLGAEALVSTVEDTIRAAGQLPPDSLADPLRVRAEIQEAFAEAAARHVPSEVLRADLDAHEMEGESGVWVLMPRGPSRRYRYRKHTSIPSVRISRPVARAIVLYDGGTLEQRLLDEGTAAWPAEAEVHLYEALPGTHLGHIAAAETGNRGGPLDTSELEQLTPQTAGLLLNQPGLGRSAAGTVGSRYYRVALPGRPATHRRHAKRVVVRLVMTGRRPAVRVHVRLGEHEARRVGELLAQRADVRVVAAFRSQFLGMATHSLPGRILRQVQRTPGLMLTSEQARTLAAVIGERMVTAVATQLRALGPTLAAATRDPASGVTLTFEFGFADPAALAAARTDAPAVTVRPGRHHD